MAAMDYEINDTRAYHIDHLDTLGWELTVCNALDPDASPCRSILKKNDSYGHLLYDYLSRFFPMQSLRKIIEIGGGYGYLMRDFIDRNKSLQPTMLDISPYLLQRQRLSLPGACFIQADIMDVPACELESFEMAILNEFLGDLPTLVDVPRDMLMSPEPLSDPVLERARALLRRYAIEPKDDERMNVNIGALRVLEKLCQAGTRFIFMSEHSCEAAAPEPWQKLVRLRPTGQPQRIRLRGHDEYTIRFTDLEKIAAAFEYKVIRGPFADFLAFDFTDQLRYKMAAASAHTDQHEIIRHFIEDLYQYEYLILLKRQDTKVAG